MTPDDLFNINTGIVKSLCTAIAKYCPNALVNMISNSVNSMPNAAKVFKKAGTYDPKRLFGMTFLDVVKTKMLNPGTAGVPVEAANVETKTLRLSTKKTQDGGTEVVEAKAGKSSATLPMAPPALQLLTFGIWHHDNN